MGVRNKLLICLTCLNFVLLGLTFLLVGEEHVALHLQKVDVFPHRQVKVLVIGVSPIHSQIVLGELLIDPLGFVEVIVFLFIETEVDHCVVMRAIKNEESFTCHDQADAVVINVLILFFEGVRRGVECQLHAFFAQKIFNLRLSKVSWHVRNYD
jgi:hypothetical protein